MTTTTTPRLHVLKVFAGPDGDGGNPLGVFLDGHEVAADRRQRVATELGYPETVFVDDPAEGAIRIFTPARELPFAGHPLVGTAWLFHETGAPATTLRPPAGDVAFRIEGGTTWIRGRADWVHPIIFDELATAADVERHPLAAMGEPGRYIWAWLNEAAGIVRSRYVATDVGILEDEANGAAAIVMGSRLGRPITIRQGVGSGIVVRPVADGMVEIGGRVELLEARDYPLSR